MKRVLSYIANPRTTKGEIELKPLRLVCSQWNIEIIKSFQHKQIVVKANSYVNPWIQGVSIAPSIDLLKNKSVNPLFSKFSFKVDSTHSLFLEFLRAAGEHTKEVSANFKNTLASIDVLRQVLEALPNLETISVFYSEDYRNFFVKRKNADLSYMEREFGNRDRRLFAPGTTRRLFPSIKHIGFHTDNECQYQQLVKELILSSPNLEDFDCSNCSGRKRIEKWFFYTVVMNKSFPTLTKLTAFNDGFCVQCTNAELKALAKRKFPLI